MTTRTWTLRALCTASMLAGTLLVGLPAYAQITGSGTVVAPPNSPPVISVPGSSPLYFAATMPTPDIDNPTEFTDWASTHGAVQAETVAPGVDGQSVFALYRFFVTDADGSSDIKDAQVKLLNPDGSVHTAYAAAQPLGANSPLTKDYYAAFEMKYFDAPAITTAFYKVVAKVADAAIQAGATPVDNALTPKLFHYSEQTQFGSTPAIDFGVLQVGSKSSGIPVTLTNLGNVPVDSVLHATDLSSGGGAIPATKIWYGPSAAAAGTNFPAETANAKRDAGFNLAPAGTRVVYLAVDVPAGTPAGVYTTDIYFTAAKHDGGACTNDCTTVSWS